MTVKIGKINLFFMLLKNEEKKTNLQRKYLYNHTNKEGQIENNLHRTLKTSLHLWLFLFFFTIVMMLLLSYLLS